MHRLHYPKKLKEDQLLLQKISQGDSKAFREFYEMHAEKVYNTSLSYLKDVHESEEITQDVFLKIHRYAGRFKGDSSVSTWIYRITVNTCLNRLKVKRRFSFFQNSSELEQGDFEHPGVKLENKENAKILYRTIDGLPENQKTAFILSYIEELPRQQVADIMETSLKSVESLLQRAKKNLRQKLEKKYPDRRK